MLESIYVRKFPVENFWGRMLNGVIGNINYMAGKLLRVPPFPRRDMVDMECFPAPSMHAERAYALAISRSIQKIKNNGNICVSPDVLNLNKIFIGFLESPERAEYFSKLFDASSVSSGKFEWMGAVPSGEKNVYIAINPYAHPSPSLDKIGKNICRYMESAGGANAFLIYGNELKIQESQKDIIRNFALHASDGKAMKDSEIPCLYGLNTQKEVRDSFVAHTKRLAEYIKRRADGVPEIGRKAMKEELCKELKPMYFPIQPLIKVNGIQNVSIDEKQNLADALDGESVPSFQAFVEPDARAEIHENSNKILFRLGSGFPWEALESDNRIQAVPKKISKKSDAAGCEIPIVGMDFLSISPKDESIAFDGSDFRAGYHEVSLPSLSRAVGIPVNQLMKKLGSKALITMDNKTFHRLEAPVSTKSKSYSPLGKGV